MAIFPGEPGLARTRMSPFWILLKLRLMEVVVTTGGIRCAKLQSDCHQQTIQCYRFADGKGMWPVKKMVVGFVCVSAYI